MELAIRMAGVSCVKRMVGIKANWQSKMCLLTIAPSVSKENLQGKPLSLENEKGVLRQLLKSYRFGGSFYPLFHFFVHIGYLLLS